MKALWLIYSPAMTSVCEIMENYFGVGIETTPTSSMVNAHDHLREAWPVRVPDEVRGYSLHSHERGILAYWQAKALKAFASHHRFCPRFRTRIGPLVRSSSQLQRTQRDLAPTGRWLLGRFKTAGQRKPSPQ